MLGLLKIIKKEEGITLVELLVYCLIMVVLLGGAYVVYQGSEAIYSSTSSQADAQRSGRIAQAKLIKQLRMLESFEAANDYSISFRADVDNDNLWNAISYYLENERLYAKVDNGQAVELVSGVRNQALNQPLFTYYDQSGSMITTDTASRKTKTQQIGVNLIIDDDINKPPSAFVLTSRVTLRNQN
ncbi:MAG: prepilin-type N-terminal cleavage/methylation domain-containing protein [Actinomycetota bacterium]|nr:prepilin-type N-terminal cleavage/methylation domain-containing protein [Actinomycetota bacterium]